MFERKPKTVEMEAMTAWPFIENIALLAAICLLVWLTDSAWWALLLVFMNTWRSAK